MNLAKITSVVWLFLCLRLAMGPPPPTLKIGYIDEDLSEFNVGEGDTDEADSLNVIHIAGTSGTLDGISNNPTITPGVKFYEFSILAPGCASQGDSVVQVNTNYDLDGHLTRSDSVEMQLAVQAWEFTVYDLHKNQTKFGMCLQADIVTINAQYSKILLERKHFDFVVTILLPTFGFDEPNLDGNGRFVFPLPCRTARRKRRQLKVHSSVTAVV